MVSPAKVPPLVASGMVEVMLFCGINPALETILRTQKKNPCSKNYIKIIFREAGDQSACHISPSYQTQYTPPLRNKPYVSLGATSIIIARIINTIIPIALAVITKFLFAVLG